MLKQVGLRITHLLFRICAQTKHVERLLQRIMKLGVFVLEAEGACFFVAEKWTNQLVLHTRYTSGKDIEFPLTGRELVELCNTQKKSWIRHNGNLFIPLYVNGMIHAVLCFLSVSRPPKDETVTLANQIVKKLNDLYKQKKTLQDKDNLHNALINISQVITQSYNFDDVITEAMQMASEVTGGSCGIMLVSKDEQFLIPAYAHNIENKDHRNIALPPAPGLDLTSYIAIKERKVVFVEDAFSDPLADHEFCEKYGIKSYMTVPLVIHDRPIGVLFVDYTYKRTFNELEVSFFKELGHQISHVINTLQTRREMLATKHMQDRLIEMIREMATRTRLRDVLHDMVLKTYHLLDRTVGVSVWLVNETGDRIKLSSWKGPEMRLDRKKGVDFSLEELGNSAKLQDLFLEFDQQSKMGKFFFESGADFSIGTPLTAGKEVIGILFLHALEGHEWTECEKLTLSTIGIHAGPIIRNVQYIQLLEKESMVDGLTKVYNRQHFEKTFQDYSSRHVIQNKPFSILMIDLDNFKQINDRYGHTVGDQVMRLVAQILQETIRRADRVFRYGGEEFCILLPWTAKKPAEQVAERIRASVEKSKIDPTVTVSIGVATFLDSTTDPKQVLELADLALYEAKSKGKNCVICAM